MKKIVSFVLIGILCVSLCSCGKPASSPVEDFEYEFNDGEVEITGYIGTDLEIVVPDTIEDRPVTTIGDEAFLGYDMTSIVLPEGIREIESKRAFNGCEMLENISLPESMQSVPNECFNDTKWYDNQPDGVLYIDDLAIGIKGDMPDEITFNSDTKAIVGGLYGKRIITNDREGGENLTDIYIPESVTYIAKNTVGYNYDYEIGGAYFPSTTITIHGKKGSVAETYAEANNITFESN